MAVVAKYFVTINSPIEEGGIESIPNGVWDTAAEAQAWIDAVIESFAPSYMRVTESFTWVED